VTAIASYTLHADKVVCEREVEGGTEVVEAALPAVLTVSKGPHEPRLASLKGIMAAKKKPLVDKPAAAAPSRVRVREMREPGVRPAGRIVGQGPDAVPELVRLLRDEAKAI
jgi:electron transfer flavoprotein beta subunit